MANVTLTLSFNSFDEAQAFMADRGIGGNQAAVRVDARSPFEKLMDELEDPRFTLRSFNELSEKTGMTRSEIEQELRDAEVEFVVKRRRSDGATLIGLEDRN